MRHCPIAMSSSSSSRLVAALPAAAARTGSAGRASPTRSPRRRVLRTHRTNRRTTPETNRQHRGPLRLQHIFGLLGVLSESPGADRRTLSARLAPAADGNDDHAADRIDLAFAYIFDHWAIPIPAAGAAKRVGLSSRRSLATSARSAGKLQQHRTEVAPRTRRKTPAGDHSLPWLPSPTGRLRKPVELQIVSSSPPRRTRLSSDSNRPAQARAGKYQ